MTNALHTIRAQDDAFVLYRYVGLTTMAHVRQFAEHVDALDYAITNTLQLEPICEHEECYLAQYQERMFNLRCFGGAAGVAYACRAHFIDHIEHASVETENAPCEVCAFCAKCHVRLTEADVDAEACTQCGWPIDEYCFDDEAKEGEVYA